MLRFAAAGLLLVAGAQAGNLGLLSLDTLAKAPVLAVCRVERTIKGADVPARPGIRAGTARYCTAKLRILRAFPELKETSLVLEYYCYGDHARIVNGPFFPTLKDGNVGLFPLTQAGRHWKLIADTGWGLIAPAIEMPPSGATPTSARAFIVCELTNAIVQGDYGQLGRFGSFLLCRGAADLNDEVMAALRVALPSGDPRWLDLSTALLAQMGVPRQKLDDLVAGPAPVPFLTDALDRFAAGALREVPLEQRREGIVRNMLRYSAVHEWGSAVTLSTEFKADPLLLKLLPDYLSGPQKGALSIAAKLAGSGQMALLDQSLDAALRVLREPGFGDGDALAARHLLQGYGSARQFGEYLALVRAAKHGNASRYMLLWQSYDEKQAPRTLRILAIPLSDERESESSRGVRYCDLAGAQLQQLSHEKFGFTLVDQMSLAERGAAVNRARTWMRAAPVVSE
jgi:hypothetical protein